MATEKTKPTPGRQYLGGFLLLSALYALFSGDVVSASVLLIVGGLVFGPIELKPSVAETPARSATLKAAPTINVVALKNKQSGLVNRLDRVRSAAFFDPQSPAMQATWNKGDPEVIRQTLIDADAANQSLWQQGSVIWRDGVALVDEARSMLHAQLKIAAMRLAEWGIAANDGAVARSGHLELRAQPFQLQKVPFSQKLNLTQGVGQGMARVASGSASPALAIAVLAGAAIYKLANKSRYLRELKAAEGTIVERGGAMAGDIAVLHQLMESRLLPHLTAIIHAIEELRTSVNAVAAEPPTSPDRPALIALLQSAVIEADRVLHTKGGD